MLIAALEAGKESSTCTKLLPSPNFAEVLKLGSALSPSSRPLQRLTPDPYASILLCILHAGALVLLPTEHRLHSMSLDFFHQSINLSHSSSSQMSSLLCVPSHPRLICDFPKVCSIPANAGLPLMYRQPKTFQSVTRRMGFPVPGICGKTHCA